MLLGTLYVANERFGEARTQFEEARKSLPEYRIEELGLEMEERRKILTRVAA